MGYKITVTNGDYPLTFECTSAHEAYGCIDSLRKGLLHDACFDMDEIMDELIKMKRGTMLSTARHHYSITMTNEN